MAFRDEKSKSKEEVVKLRRNVLLLLSIEVQYCSYSYNTVFYYSYSTVYEHDTGLFSYHCFSVKPTGVLLYQ